MTRGSCFVERNKLARLRADIAAIERRDAPRPVLEAPVLGDQQSATEKRFIATGVDSFDDQLGGGIMRAGMAEFCCTHMRDTGALTGFAALVLILAGSHQNNPIVWISVGDICHEAGLLHSHGLADLGFQTIPVLNVHIGKMADALWVAEEAATTKGLGAVVLDMRGYHGRLGLKETRRLHMRARAAGNLFLLLRHRGAKQTDTLASAALYAGAMPLRLMIGPAPSLKTNVTFGRAIGPPGFHIWIDKNKTGPAGSFHTLYWSHYERGFFVPDTIAQPDTGPSKRLIRAPDSLLHVGCSTQAEPDRFAAFPVFVHRSDHAGAARNQLAQKGR